MKLPLLVFVLLFSFAKGTYAQVDSTPPPPPLDTVSFRQTTAPMRPMPPRPTAPKPRVDTVRGNAGRFVSMIEVKGDCGNGMKALAVTNKSQDKAVKARVDVIVTYGSKVTAKSIVVDNLAPNEVRNVGCGGCIGNATGKTCTEYKLVGAMFK